MVHMEFLFVTIVFSPPSVGLSRCQCFDIYAGYHSMNFYFSAISIGVNYAGVGLLWRVWCPSRGPRGARVDMTRLTIHLFIGTLGT